MRDYVRDKLGQFADIPGVGDDAAKVHAADKLKDYMSSRKAGKAKQASTVEWDGPAVAEPNQRATAEWQQLWQSRDFDSVKGGMRAGALDAQVNGYKGMPAGKLTEAVMGKEIVATAVHSPPTTEPLYRGISVSQETYNDMTSGKSVSLPLSAFTSDESEARIRVGAFKDAGEQWRGFDIWKSQDVPQGFVPLLLRLEPGAKAAKLDGTADNHSSQREAVTFGTFAKTGIQPIRGLSSGTLTQINLRQTSMREKAR